MAPSRKPASPSGAPRRSARSAAGLAACALAAPLWLAGCAALAPPTTPAVAPAARSYHEAIELGGRLSVRYQEDGREQALHGSFSWAQTPGRTELVLLSPLGQTLAAIEVTPAAATLARSGQPPRVAADADALARQALGWPLPVAGLRDWLQGFVTGPGGGRRAVAPSADNALASDGWRIRYASWQDDGAGPAHPKRIDLERDTADAGTVALRIVIDRWQVH